MARHAPASLLDRWGRFVARRRWLVLAGSLALFAVTLAAVLRGGHLTNEFDAPTESMRGFDLAREELPRESGSSFMLVFSHPTLDARDPAFAAQVEDALSRLREDARIASVATPYEEDNPRAGAFVSTDAERALAIVSVKDEYEVATRYYPELRALVDEGELEVLATGNLAIQHDFDETLERDLQRAEVVALPVTLVLLVVVFGTAVAALLPLAVGVLAVVGGLAATFLLSDVTDVSTYALNIVTLIGLGVAIDYSLFIVSRFREELARGADRESALARAMQTAGRATLFSGLTVAIGLGGMLFYRGTFLASMGLAGALVVGIAVLYSITFLPAVLALLGERVNRFPIPFASRTRRRRFWHALAMGVMKRPVAVLVPVLALLLVAGAPFLQIRLASGDVNMLPESAEARRGYEILLDEFPGQDQTRFTVLLRYDEGDPLGEGRVGEIYDASRAIATIPGVLRVESLVDLDPTLAKADYERTYAAPPAEQPPAARAVVRETVGEHVVALSVLSADPAHSDEARDIVRALREMDDPAGGEMIVTGQTAFDMDTIEFILSRTPVAVAAVVLVTYALILAQVRSVLIPLKAVVMNLLSISASFGALVWIFQQGNLANVLGFTPASIDPTLPVILFCIVFGLSMDYEVLLLSRMHEEYQRTRDNRRAVAEGLEKSGRLITGAAAIMIVVFAAFALSEVVIIKAVGLGLAIAVAVDATLVRALVVPATMRLLGDLNWWAPRGLRAAAEPE